VLLLVACANVCSLLLARGARQQREFAVRQVLGSTRWRLIRYQLIESIMLAFGGAVLGVFLTILVVGWFVRLAPAQVAGVEGIHVDARVLVFTSIVAVVAGLLFGLIPALESGRVSLASASSDTARATLTGRQRRLGRALIVFELATSLVLLTCAGLLSRSFARVLSIDPGFQPEGVLVARIALPSDRYSAEAAGRFFSQLLEQARHLPGVESAALGDVTPLTGARRTITRSDDRGGQSPPIDLVVVSPNYFTTVGAPLIRGRDIGREDRSDGQRVVVINATLARVLYGEANPVGQPFDFVGDPRNKAVVVGVVKDILGELEAAAHPVAFIPASQAEPSTRMNLLLRTRGTVIPLQQSVRTVVHSMDATLPVQKFETLEQSLSEAVAPRRFSFVLLTVFALLAATLAAVGLYGVMAYHVADRTREIGIRTALGAEPKTLLQLVVRQGMTLSLVGIILGLMGSVAAVRLLRHMLFGVSIYDPWTFAAAALLLGLVAIIACWMPAQRAANVDPTVALRAE
jgi:putative ABC transport system permease protein